jgi:hypothetical protein
MALMGAGYVVRQMCFDAKGKFDGYDYFVFERPEHAEEWKTVNGKTVNGKTATSKNEDTLSEYQNKNEQQQEAKIDVAVFDSEVNALVVDSIPLEAEKKESPTPIPPPPSPTKRSRPAQVRRI